MLADDEKAGPKLETRRANAPFGVVDDALDMSWTIDVEELDAAFDDDVESASKWDLASLLRRTVTFSSVPP